MLRLAALILPLSLDTFAVSAAVGTAGVASARRLRLSLTVAGFQGLMPLIGIGVGAGAGRLAGRLADPIAAAILVAIGVFMLREHEGSEGIRNPGGGWPALVALCLSVSIDELAIGVSAGLLRLPIVLACILIALQGFVAAEVGMRLGGRIGVRTRENAERLAGAALVALGVALLIAGRG